MMTLVDSGAVRKVGSVVWLRGGDGVVASGELIGF